VIPARRTPVGLLFLAALLFVANPSVAATYYQLGLDDARLNRQGLFEDGRKFALTTEGGGQPARIRTDRKKGSRVLVLRTTPTPQGAKKDRAEIRIYSGISFERDWFVGLEVFVPRNVPPSDTWHLLLQCHQAGTNISPPISLDLEPDGNLSLVVRDDADTYDRLWSGPFPRGRWVQLVLGFRMGKDGRAQLWQDGRLVSSQRRSLGWNAGERRCVLKTGLYRGAAATPFEIRLDNVMLGDRYGDVVAR
jgi:Polysaccharide lyase